jgi:predicted nucleotidyltransferase
MKETIIDKLKEIEASQQVRILFACESGSRAWGFHSIDSDYDVRFVYVHNSDWYLSIEDKKDVIQLPVNEVLDISGWDVRKALKLFRSSNSVIYEWLQSPILYNKGNGFIQELFSLRGEYYSMRSGMHHYLSMAINSFQNDLQENRFKLKKYFYALRPILAACWIAEKKECPPMEFAKLRLLIADAVINQRINDLLDAKFKVDEKFEIQADPVLHEFLRERISFCETISKEMEPLRSSSHSLNKLFRKTIGL